MAKNHEYDPIALQMSDALAADLAARGFHGHDPAADRRLHEELKASLETQEAARRRHEQSLRGRLVARRLWPRDELDWILVALVVWAIVGILGFGYAGCLEATAPVSPMEGP
jgi:hypothetical protein